MLIHIAAASSDHALVYQLNARLNELCSLCAEWKEKTKDIPTGRPMSDSWGPSSSDIAGARTLRSQAQWIDQYEDDAEKIDEEPKRTSTTANADDESDGDELEDGSHGDELEDQSDDDELEDDPDLSGLSEIDEEDASVIGELEEGVGFRADQDDVPMDWDTDEEFGEDFAMETIHETSPTRQAPSPTKRSRPVSRTSSPFGLYLPVPGSPTKRKSREESAQVGEAGGSPTKKHCIFPAPSLPSSLTPSTPTHKIRQRQSSSSPSRAWTKPIDIAWISALADDIPVIEPPPSGFFAGNDSDEEVTEMLDL